MLEKCKHPRFAWILALMPVLSLYGISSINLDFGTIVIIVIIIYIALKEKRVYLQISNNRIWFLYLAYMVVSLAFPRLWGINSDASMVMRTIKNVIYILLLLISTSNNWINYQLFKECYMKICKLATIFILIQSVAFYVFHRTIPGYVNFMLISEGYGDRLSQPVTGLYRPTSFFYEPSHYFEYVVPSLIISLFGNERNITNKDIYFALLVSIGVVFSTSGMGMITLALCWGIWLLKNGKGLNIRKNVLLISILFLCAAVAFLRTSYAQSILLRVFGNAASGVTYTAVNARTDVYEEIFKQGFVRVFLGNGYGNTLGDYYFPSWAFNIWCLGIAGSFIICCIYIKYFFATKRDDTRMIVFINAFLSVGTTLFMGKNLFLYFLIIILQVQEIEYAKKIYCGNDRFILSSHDHEREYCTKHS